MYNVHSCVISWGVSWREHVGVAIMLFLLFIMFVVIFFSYNIIILVRGKAAMRWKDGADLVIEGGTMDWWTSRRYPAHLAELNCNFKCLCFRFGCLEWAERIYVWADTTPGFVSLWRLLFKKVILYLLDSDRLSYLSYCPATQKACILDLFLTLSSVAMRAYRAVLF